MATAPRLERALYGHVLTEREAQLIGSAAISVNLVFTALGLGFYVVGTALGSLPPTSVFQVAVATHVGCTGLCVLLWWRGQVALLSLFVALGLLGTGASTWLLQGGMAPSLIGYNTIAVLVAGLLFGSRGALAMAGLFAGLATSFLFIGRPADPELVATFRTPEVIWVVQVACIASAVAVAQLGYHRVQLALAVAERHRLDLELRGAELEESREHFRLIAENASDLLSEYALDGRRLFMNPSGRRFLGLDDPPARLEQNLALLHPDDRERLRSVFERLPASGTANISPFRVRAADGAWHWMEARAGLFNPPVGPPRIVSMSRDISARKQAEEELERRVAERTRELAVAVERLRAEVEQREQMQESLRHSQHLASIGTFAAGIAHEISNPVGSILVAADDAQRLYDEPAARREVETLLRKIRHEAARAGRIVKSVLALSRQTPSERWIGDLNEVVRSSRDHLRELVARSGARLEFELDPDLTPFPMNPTELEQVVVNLVHNAIESGGHGVCVRVRTETAPQGVRLRVLDDGPGIAEGEELRIFDPFYTTRRSQGGVGLGLSLVHGIVTGHGGSVEVRGAPGAGTEFVLEFHAEYAGGGPAG